MNLKKSIEKSLSKIQSCLLLSYEYDNLNEFKTFSMSIKKIKKKFEQEKPKAERVLKENLITLKETKTKILQRRKIKIKINGEIKEFFYPMIKITDNEKKRRELELNKLNSFIKKCENCELYTSRKNSITGFGSVSPVVLILIHAPDFQQDESGKINLSENMNYLKLWLSKINLDLKTDCFLSSIVKCRPVLDKTPSENQIKTCLHYTLEEIKILSPIIILALGDTTVSSLLSKNIKINKKRGQIMQYKEIPVVLTHTPKSVFENQNLKKEVWDDLKKLRSYLIENAS